MKPKEKQRREKKEVEEKGDGAAEDTVAAASATGTSHAKPEKKWKHKNRHEDEDTSEHAMASVEVVEDGKKVKRKKKRKASDEQQLVVDEIEPMGLTSAAEVVEQSTDRADEKTKKKEEKRKRKEIAEGETAEHSTQEPKKKKRKSRSALSEFSDPAEDESLTDQARKALEYTFMQFAEPTAWKFNKARQNWLIRNVWSPEAIPELYVPLLTRYLSGVQGAVRETLLKTCRDILASQTSQTPSPAHAETQPSVHTPVGVDANTTKHSRATALLAVLVDAAL